MSEAGLTAGPDSAPSPDGTQHGPLHGLRVVEVASIIAGPFCSMLLADLGAEVVKFETPGTGDPMRTTGQKHQASGDALWWKVIGRNKKSIAADLHLEADRELIRRFARNADVLIEAFRPGRMEKWGLGWEDLSKDNPGLVMARISGFGQTGPNRERPGFGTLAEAMSGLAAVSGWPDRPPSLPSFGLGDSIAGMSTAIGILAALQERNRSGLGQMVDVALVEPMMTILGAQLPLWEMLGIKLPRVGNSSQSASPRGAYLCSDGQWLAISGATEATAHRLLEAIGHPELVQDPRFATNAARVKHNDLLDQMICDWSAGRTIKEALRILLDCDVVAGPIYDAEGILNDEHFKARESYIRVNDPQIGPVPMPNVMHRLSRTPGKVVSVGPALNSSAHEVDDILARWAGASQAGRQFAQHNTD